MFTNNLTAAMYHFTHSTRPALVSINLAQEVREHAARVGVTLAVGAYDERRNAVVLYRL